MSSNPAVKQYKALGDEVWKSKVDKIVSRLFFKKEKERETRKLLRSNNRMPNFLL